MANRIFLAKGMVIVTIYYIDSSISKEFGARDLTAAESQFFLDLASAYRHGYCLLCGDSTSLQCLCARCDPFVKDVCNAVHVRHAEHGAAMKAVRSVFVLTYETDPNISSLPTILQENGKAEFIHVPTAISENWRMQDECRLVVENLDDYKFYQVMAEHYCSQRKIPKSFVHFYQESGGGNTICDALEKCVQEKRIPALCIVDSDQKHGKSKKYPNEPAMGDTYHRAKDVSDALSAQKNLPPHCLVPLHVHEVENLIPTQLLSELNREQHLGMEAGLSRINEFQGINNGEPLLYYDYKAGFPFLPEGPMRVYWEEVLLALGGDLTDMPPLQKPKKGTYDRKLLFFPPLNSYILRYAIKKLRAEETNIQIDDAIRPIWEEVGALLLTWGYSTEPLRA